MTMRLQRFDFGALHDFRRPIVINEKALEPVVEAPPPPPPPPTFTEKEMEAQRDAARKLGYAEGVEAGIAQAASESAAREKDTLHLLTRIQEQMAQLSQTYERLIAQQSTELSELVLMIARKVAGEALDSKGVDTIVALVNRCLPAIFGKPRIAIDLHPQMADQASPVIAVQLAEQGYEGDIQFRANAQLEKNDVIIDWVGGQARRSTEDLWQEINGLLQHVDLTPTLPAENT